MKHFIFIPAIAFTCVAFAALTGQSESAGLFGAVIAVGLYCVSVKDAA